MPLHAYVIPRRAYVSAIFNQFSDLQERQMNHTTMQLQIGTLRLMERILRSTIANARNL
jgi:hypothetical protein